MPERDPNHWLYKLSPREWISAAVNELSRAEAALANRDRRGGLAACRRAAGMALNGALASSETPDARHGRSYMDHLLFLRGATDERDAPREVLAAAALLVETPLPAGGAPLVALRTSGADERLLEATRTLMAHALSVVLKSEPLEEAARSPVSEAGPAEETPATTCPKSDPPGEAQ